MPISPPGKHHNYGCDCSCAVFPTIISPREINAIGKNPFYPLQITWTRGRWPLTSNQKGMKLSHVPSIPPGVLKPSQVIKTPCLGVNIIGPLLPINHTPLCVFTKLGRVLVLRILAKVFSMCSTWCDILNLTGLGRVIMFAVVGRTL